MAANRNGKILRYIRHVRIVRWIRCLAVWFLLFSIPLSLKYFQIIQKGAFKGPLTRICSVLYEFSNGTAQNYSINGMAAAESLCPNRIPKIIHLTFATEHVYNNYLPLLKRCIDLNPDWQVYLWRDSDSEKFIKEFYPWFSSKFNSYQGDLQKSDAVRYAVLHAFGGVYLDMDIECMRPLFPGLLNEAAFIDRERWEQATILYDRPLTLMNSVMGSVPGHPFFKFILQNLGSFSGSYPVDSTGPGALTKIYADWLTSSEAKTAQKVTVLRSEMFSGTVDPDNPIMKVKCHGISSEFKNPGTEARKRLAAELAGFNPDSTSGSFKSRDRRWLACASLSVTDWSPGGGNGLRTNATIGVHKFMHLGYGFASGKRGPKFDLIAEFRGRIRLPDGGRGVSHVC